MKTVAVIGASADRAKFGNKSVRAHARAGYHVYPINPRETEIEGFPVFRSIRDLPAGRIDRVSLYLPQRPALAELDELTAREVGEVSSNPGADPPDVVAKARQLGLNAVVGCSIEPPCAAFSRCQFVQYRECRPLWKIQTHTVDAAGGQ